MSEGIKIAIAPSSGSSSALCFESTTKKKTPRPVHWYRPGPQPLCADYKRRTMKEVAKTHKWCSPCADMLLRITVVKGCQDCMNDYVNHQDYIYTRGKGDSTSGYGWSLPPPTNGGKKWWCGNDADIKQLRDVKMTSGSDKPSKWPSPVNDTDGVAMKRLGFKPDCALCFAFVQAFVAANQESTDPNVKVVTQCIEFQPRQVSLSEKDGVLNIKFRGLRLIYYEPVSEVQSTLPKYQPYQKRPEPRNPTKRKYITLDLQLNQGPENFGLTFFNPLRFNPAFLKEKLTSQYGRGESVLAKTVAESGRNLPASFRLIDVKTQCVVEVGNTDVKYSAISHRWDTSAKTMLTKDNLSELRKPGSLTTEVLSKTLYECMMLARDLDIPYIWIDRYCIVQDDSAEKAEHIESVDQVFGRSCLTMMCALSKDIHSGLPGYSRNFLDPTAHGEVTDDVCEDHVDDWLLWKYRPAPDWVSRCWTFAENRLSPYRLYLTDYAVMCQINGFTNIYPNLSAEDRQSKNLDYSDGKQSSLPRLLQLYSRRKLTNPEERLAIISPVLRAYGFDHLYGIETGNFMYNLLWNTVKKFSGTSDTTIDSAESIEDGASEDSNYPYDSDDSENSDDLDEDADDLEERDDSEEEDESEDSDDSDDSDRPRKPRKSGNSDGKKKAAAISKRVNDNFPTWSWANVHKKASWPDEDYPGTQTKHLVLHAKTHPEKRRRLLKCMGLSSSFANKLSDRQVILRAKARFTHNHYGIHFDYDRLRFRLDRGVFIVRLLTQDLQSGENPCKYTSLVFKAFTPPEGLKHPNVIHVRRVGHHEYETESAEDGENDIRYLYKLGWLRPMALQSLTTLKSFRLKHSLRRSGYRAIAPGQPSPTPGNKKKRTHYQKPTKRTKSNMAKGRKALREAKLEKRQKNSFSLAYRPVLKRKRSQTYRHKKTQITIQDQRTRVKKTCSIEQESRKSLKLKEQEVSKVLIQHIPATLETIYKRRKISQVVD